MLSRDVRLTDERETELVVTLFTLLVGDRNERIVSEPKRPSQRVDPGRCLEPDAVSRTPLDGDLRRRPVDGVLVSDEPAECCAGRTDVGSLCLLYTSRCV